MVREHFAPIVNLADAWQQLATAQPEASALVHDGRIVTWADFAVRAGGLAHHLVTSGCRQQDTVTQFLRNTPHYLESIFACAAAGLVPVNTNHRYTDGELTYLWSNASVGAVIFAGEFTETCSRLRPAFPGIHAWVHVDDGSGACPEWATPYETAASSRPDGGNYAPPWPRTGDDLLLMYTGGTTGRPKGVMWRQADLIGALDLTRRTRLPAADPATAAQPPVHLAGAPLMHGTGQFNSISNLLAGGSVVTVPGRSFDPVALLDAVDANRVATMSIIGDVFARPLVDTVTADPHR